jgi:GAF domain-containing protein
MSEPSLDLLDMSTPQAKQAAYATLLAQSRALFEGESDWLANLSQFSALVFNAVPQLNWAGFYMVAGDKPDELVLGPFQGKVACVRIPFAKGVCGACARTREPQLVPDVHAFPGHIACDSASNSELVLPVLVQGRLRAVFDLDSPVLARFDAQDAQGLGQALAALVAATRWP